MHKNGNNSKNIASIEFVGYIMSFIHSLMISTTSILIMYNYNENNIMHHASSTKYLNLIFIFKLSTVFSVSYFIVDIIDLILFYSHKNFLYRFSFIIHHLLVLLCQLTVFISSPYITYQSAIGMFIEFSTIFLNIRIFGKIFNNKLLFKFGGIATLIFYPLTRIFPYNVYCLYFTYYSKIDYYLCLECKILLLVSEFFVLLLSLQYFISMMKNPKSIYVLTKRKRQ